ncbi:MAG: glutamine--fructose-6-phosphate transaminase (isomerizing) [Pseudomonadota bacterium]
MCGIMGYVGGREAAPILIEGLRRLEYRGYDSAGIAVCRGNELSIERSKGKLSDLEAKLFGRNLAGNVGIGHTRWATHGKPSDENAHPHRSEHVVVIHNGIIENYLDLRKKLTAEGFTFASETDTEIVPFLIEFHMRSRIPLEEAVRKAIEEIRGAFAFAVLSSTEPDKIIAVKNASPLILGIGKGENFLASDIPALLDHTRDVIVLEDGEMAVLEKDRVRLCDFHGKSIQRKPKHITWSRVMAEKEGFKHFMLKEIHEQPGVLADTLRGRIVESTGEVILDDVMLAKENGISRIVIVACGTSWHAALVGKYWIESLARIPVEVDLASEYRYRKPVVDPHTLLIVISQSGETADTLAALEEAKRGGAKILSICNVVDSSITRKSDGVLYTHAGPEIGVASTKAFTTQLCVLALIALHFAKMRDAIGREALTDHIRALLTLPKMAEAALRSDAATQAVATKFLNVSHFLFLGRGSSYPIALEGALKLKEISYIHAEGYAGGEMKHGPIALIDEKMPIVALATGGPTQAKMMSNIEEVRARGGRVIAVVSEGDKDLARLSTMTIEIPVVADFIRPIIEAIPLQLLAYHFADKRGTDVDQPRNLAKSVTVE